MRWTLLVATLALAACDVSTTTTQTPVSAPSQSNSSVSMNRTSFTNVVARVEPVAERECRSRLPGANCDFLIRIDGDRRAAPNAYQSEDESGRPVITFTESMISSTRNPDELAFVLGHEAAHHIRGHLARQAENAAAGAIIFAGLAAMTGGSAADVQAAQQLGEAVGARSYSKEFELEADQLGTIITATAGYNPIAGSQYFARIPDPGDRFLGTHPPNAERLEIVQRTAAQMGLRQ
ncbi:M48 family metallopeptidase [Falsiphaeobacter marinintestinus]|uniref:M48 family metallopeptidase n=1 Tax=Falsiphaeobacter marinintestinus TaxID=1492905 RepID=UPI0011B6AD00|nr:M48 family metallopeptidase [Phaeobacter marinintestinus]